VACVTCVTFLDILYAPVGDLTARSSLPSVTLQPLSSLDSCHLDSLIRLEHGTVDLPLRHSSRQTFLILSFLLSTCPSFSHLPLPYCTFLSFTPSSVLVCHNPQSFYCHHSIPCLTGKRLRTPPPQGGQLAASWFYPSCKPRKKTGTQVQRRLNQFHLRSPVRTSTDAHMAVLIHLLQMRALPHCSLAKSGR
jgi:hypothetical protein